MIYVRSIVAFRSDKTKRSVRKVMRPSVGVIRQQDVRTLAMLNRDLGQRQK
jgi:hypothetical protein